jgi:predicted DNA-binding ribbon-helix-helix protein
MERRTSSPATSLSGPKRDHSSSPVIKHSIKKKTSVSLEAEFWSGLRDIAASEGVAIAALIERIHTTNEIHNLSSAIRVFVLNYFRNTSSRPPQ